MAFNERSYREYVEAERRSQERANRIMPIISKWIKDYTEAVEKGDEEAKQKLLEERRKNCKHFDEHCMNINLTREVENRLFRDNEDFDCSRCKWLKIVSSYK